MKRAWLVALLALVVAGCPRPVAPDDAGTPPVDSGLDLPDGGPAPLEPDAGYFVDRTSGVPDPASIQELPVQLSREFDCEPSDVGPVSPIAVVEGASGEDVVIRPVREPCYFDLHYRVGATETPLSAAPSGYLMAAAQRFPDGVRLVCASEISHRAIPGSLRGRVTEGVNIRCWSSATTSFAATVLAVPAGSDWAAWVRSVEPAPAQSGAYLVTWVRDFSFQFFNMSDTGRPSTDGVYQTLLQWSGTALTAGATTRLSAVTNPFTGSPELTWEPDDEEIRRMGSFIDFSGLDGGAP